MNTLVNALLESSLLIGMAYLLYRFVLSNTGHFGWNRIFLVSSILLAIILPWLNLGLPFLVPALTDTKEGFSLAAILLPELQVAVPNTSGTAIETMFPSWLKLTLAVYFLGFTVFAFLFLQNLLQVAAIIRRAEPKNYAGRQLLLSQEQPTFSFLNYLVLNDSKDFMAWERERILVHEEAHIQQGHSFDLLLAELLKIALWFNPFSWWFKNAVQENCEFLADAAAVDTASAAVVAIDTSGVKYAALLVEHAIHARRMHSVLHHFNQHQIKRRVKMLRRKNAQNWRPYLIGMPLLALTVFIVSCSGMTEQVSEQVQGETAKKLAAAELSDDITPIADLDQMPSFPGGSSEMIAFLSEEINYPKDEEGLLEGGKVFVQFVISENGEVTRTKVAKGLSPLFDAEAVRAVSAMPNWIPGEKDGKTVKVLLTLPIQFAKP